MYLTYSGHFLLEYFRGLLAVCYIQRKVAVNIDCKHISAVREEVVHHAPVPAC